MKKVYAIVTLFYPKLCQLKELLYSLSKQTSFIVICNNSDYELPTCFFKNLKFVNVINFKKNLGIARAQSIGMKWAFNNGADFVLQMDQDSMPHDDMVEQLKMCYENLTTAGYNVGLVGVQDYDKFTKEINKARFSKGTLIYNSDYFNVDSTLSSGSLISREAYNQIGGMRDDLFIDAVDHEYCWRLKDAGFLVIRNSKALLGHRLGDGKFKVLSLFSVGLPSPFRHYYATRNIFILLKEKHVPIFWKISSLIKMIAKLICYPLFLPEGKKRFVFLLKGIKDGIKGTTGELS